MHHFPVAIGNKPTNHSLSYANVAAILVSLPTEIGKLTALQNLNALSSGYHHNRLVECAQSKSPTLSSRGHALSVAVPLGPISTSKDVPYAEY